MALEEETDFEHTLAVFREVSAFKIPPRLASGTSECHRLDARSSSTCSKEHVLMQHSARRWHLVVMHSKPSACGAYTREHVCECSIKRAGGVKSGEWRVEDKIFTGRLTLMSCGHKCELRLTDDKCVITKGNVSLTTSALLQQAMCTAIGLCSWREHVQTW